MNYFIGAILTVTLMSVAFLSPVNATHNPGVGAQVGETPSVIAWCRNVDDVRGAIQANEDEVYVEYISKEDNTCVDIRVAQRLGFPLQPLPIGVVELVDSVVIQDGAFVAQIVRAAGPNGKDVYTWHWMAANRA